MNSPELEKLIEQIWKDADFKIEEKKKLIKLEKLKIIFIFLIVKYVILKLNYHLLIMVIIHCVFHIEIQTIDLKI